MTPSRFILFPLFLAVLGFTGCHASDIHPLPGSAHPAYAIMDLGIGMPHDINNRGQIVGEYSAGVFPNSNGFTYFHGCLWDKGKRIDMPTLGGWYSDAGSITDTGKILGSASVPGRTPNGLPLEHLGLWDGHRLIDLDADPRFLGTRAVHITQTGSVYAASPPQKPKSQLHLWFYPSGFGPGVRRDVGVIGGPQIKPMFINDSGMVVGTWNTGEKNNATDKIGVNRAFAWHPGDRKWTDLGTFGGRDSEPAGLNNKGQVIGDAMLSDDLVTHRWREHAFLWEKGQMRDLGTLPGGYRSRPCAINSQGQIVGYSDIKGEALSDRPVLWEHGQIQDLTELIPSGTTWMNMGGAEGINDQGQIVGDGVVLDAPGHYDAHVHAYLLTRR